MRLLIARSQVRSLLEPLKKLKKKFIVVSIYIYNQLKKKDNLQHTMMIALYAEAGGSIPSLFIDYWSWQVV